LVSPLGVLCVCGSRRPPRPSPFPYTTLFRSRAALHLDGRPRLEGLLEARVAIGHDEQRGGQAAALQIGQQAAPRRRGFGGGELRSEEHTSELQSRENLVCRLLLEKKKTQRIP